MIDNAAFVRHVKDALDNLYDPVHLQVHPLIDALTLRRLPRETGGEALRKLLWEAVDALKPPASVPLHRPEWLSYRLLSLHYIQLFDQEAVQRELGLAERTFYRRLQEAVEAVASVLWDSYRVGDGPPDDRPQMSAAPANSVSLARQKALRLIQDGHRQVVSLNDVASSAVETVLPLFEQQGCSLALDIPVDLPSTCGDPAVLHQIVVNMLLGGLEVAAGRALALGVAHRGDETIWRVSGLSGARSPQDLLGLSPVALSRELAESGVGELWVDRDPEGAPMLTLSIASVPSTTILVIDDDADARQLLGRVLGVHGYVVREAHSAEGVQAILTAAAPDLILLDVLMPQEDGWKLLQRLKTQDETASIPVVICSVLGQADLATALGAAAVVQKPISEEALIETVGQVLAPVRQGPRSADSVGAPR
jgi:CheY-like chemotaxis protein